MELEKHYQIYSADVAELQWKDINMYLEVVIWRLKGTTGLKLCKNSVSQAAKIQLKIMNVLCNAQFLASGIFKQ